MRHGHEVEKTSGCANENVTSPLKFVLLLSLWRTTVGHARSQHGSITQPTCFIEDLGAQLTSGSNHKDQRFSTDRIDGRIEAVG